MKVKEIINIIDIKLGLASQESWDNSGLQIGSYNQPVKNILLALDMCEEVANYAVQKKIDLVITHHPFIFKAPLMSLDLDTYEGKIIKKLINNNITLYSMHTLLDAAKEGIGKELGIRLGVKNTKILAYQENNLNISYGYGGVGQIEPISIIEYSEFVKKSLQCDKVRLYSANKDKTITRVAFCGGGGEDFIDNAISLGAELYVTGDIDYHHGQYAINRGLSVLDAGHFYTENIIIDKIYDCLDKNGLNVKKYMKNTVYEYFI